VPKGSSEELAKAIAALAGDRELRSRMGEFNRARALVEFDVRAVIQKIDGIYQQVIGRS
jgi:glycosyltransferase involved in cell wall biosynthesis